jgi:hypothetical protein
MKLPRLLFACAMLLAVAFGAGAAPGDPRLVTGVLEWPRTITNEPFVVVRGDDGALYYVGVTSARREGAATAGARVAVLGTEGRSAHEINAFALSSGPTPEAALAQLQGRPAPSAPAPSGSTAAVAPAPSGAGTAAAPAPSGSAAAAAPSSSAGAVAPAPSVTTPAAPASGHAAGVKAAPPAAAPSAASGAAPAPAAAPVPAAATAAAPASTAAPVAAAAAAPASNTIVATAPMLPIDQRRWTELTGEVESLSGRTLILKVDGGRVTVDVSSLSANLERMVAPGSRVKVYGVPVELRFKAMGFIDPDSRGRVR